MVASRRPRPPAWPLLLAVLVACGEGPGPSADRAGAAPSAPDPNLPDPAGSEPAGSDPAGSDLAGSKPGSAPSGHGSTPPEAPPGARPETPPGAAVLRLVDEAAARGLDHVNRSGGAAKNYVLEANGGGVAALDLGADGDLDLVFSQGLDSIERAVTGPGADLEVFVNDGSGHFTRAEGPGLNGWWTGLATGDVDGDGRADLVAGGFGRLVLLTQDAAGALRASAELLDPAERWTPGGALPEGPPAWFTSLALFDADRDGDLDLYAGTYLEFDPRDPPRGALGEGPLAVPCRWREHEVFCGPHGLVAQPDRLYILETALDADGNRAGLSYVDRSERLQGLVPAYTLATASFDADGDGDTDLYVAADSVANSLWINTGEAMQEVAWSAGVAVSSDGNPEAGMGIAIGDVNRDGRADLAVTNFSGEPTQLYLGAEFGYDTGTHRYGMQRASRELLSWGAHLFDVDGDGWLELFTANGHVYPQADLADTGTRYGQPDSLWRLGPDPRAVAVDPHGPDSILTPPLGTRGSAVGDFDGDGAPDLALSRIDGPAALGMNRTGSAGHRLTLRLVNAAGADVIGARAIAVARRNGSEQPMSAEVRTAEGYQSASSPWLHFGFGSGADGQRFERIEVRWPSGASETIEGGPTDRFLIVQEGRGLVDQRPLR